jgi:hypothetical protein
MAAWGRILTLPPHPTQVATSSSPLQTLSQGDEDIAAPFQFPSRGGDVLVALFQSPFPR